MTYIVPITMFHSVNFLPSLHKTHFFSIYGILWSAYLLRQDISMNDCAI